MQKTLLIIDDNKEIIDVVSEILKDMFSKIESATTVDRAEVLLVENTFDIIILDINLEGRNGAEIIKYLIENDKNSNCNTPFLIISGIITPQFIEKNCKRFAGILMKPFEHSEIYTMVENIIGGKKVEIETEAGEIPYVKCKLPFPIAQLEQRVNKIVDQVKKSSKLKQLFAQMQVDRSGDNYLLTHVGMLINISTGICIQMGWNTDKTLEKFVYAAYLHDMALSARPELAKINTRIELEIQKDKLSASDYKLVFEHPNIAAKTLEDILEVPHDVAMIIRQHHELPKENGYPTGCSFQKIAPLCTVFIVAHDLTEHILSTPNWTIEEYVKKAKSRFTGAHFSKVLLTLLDI